MLIMGHTSSFTVPASLAGSRINTLPSTTTTSLRSIPEGVSLKQKEADDKRREYELALGKAADTLRHDYPRVLNHSPNFEIFDEEIELVDPSGVTLHGIRNYKRTFGVLRAVIAFFYNEHESEVKSRMMFDYATKSIRITWHATLTPKVIYGGPMRKVHLDGISVYELNRDTGRIYQHRLERACMNNEPIRYPQGIWSALNTEVVQRHGIPVAGGYCTDTSTTPKTQLLTTFAEAHSSPEVPLDGMLWRHGELFQKGTNNLSGRRIKVLAGVGARRSTRLNMSSSSSLAEESTEKPTMEADEDLALERALLNKNRSRSKFGLKPITMEEFKLQREQVSILEQSQKEKLNIEREKRVNMMAAAAAKEEAKNKRSPLDAFLSAVSVPDRCESNDDCERPLLCCDFIFKKICCASGTPVGHYNSMERLAYVTVPARADPQYPENF